MLYTVLGLRGGKYVPIGEANGLHAQAAILTFRKRTGIGGKMQAKSHGTIPARENIITPITMEGDMRLSKVVTPAPAYYDMRKPEAKEAWADRVASYEAEKVHTSKLLGE